MRGWLLHSGSVLKIEPAGLAGELDLGSDRKDEIRSGPGVWPKQLEGWSCPWEEQVGGKNRGDCFLTSIH